SCLHRSSTLNRWFGTSGTTPQDICDYQVAFLLCHVEWGPSPGIGFVDIGTAVDQGLNQLRKSVTGNIVEGRPALAGQTLAAAPDADVGPLGQQQLRRFRSPPEQCCMQGRYLDGVLRDRIYISSAG